MFTVRLRQRRPCSMEFPRSPFNPFPLSGQSPVVVSTRQVEDPDELPLFSSSSSNTLPPSRMDLASWLCAGRAESSGVKTGPLVLLVSSEAVGERSASLCDVNSCSFCPFRLRRAGLMRGRRPRAELEVEVTEPAIEGVGEGPGEDGRLPDLREK